MFVDCVLEDLLYIHNYKLMSLGQMAVFAKSSFCVVLIQFYLKLLNC